MKNCPICQSDEDVAAIEYLEGLLCKREINGPIGRHGRDGSSGAENLQKEALNDVCLVIWQVLNFIFQFASCQPRLTCFTWRQSTQQKKVDVRWLVRWPNRICIMAGRLLVKGSRSATWYDKVYCIGQRFLSSKRPVKYHVHLLKKKRCHQR